MTIEEKAKAYDEAIRKAKDMLSYKEVRQEDMEYLFPELKESEDEQSKKWILEYLYDGMRHSDEQFKGQFNTAIAWLVKQNKSDKSLYIRFGDIPTNGKSKVYNGEIEIGIEEGISVYPAFEDKEGNIILGLNLPITKTSLHTQQHLLEYDNRPCYLVTGDYVGKGTDGEPLIKNVRIIKEIKPYRIKQDKENNTYIINNTPNCGIAVYNEELKDSADERIRKWLIDWAKAVNWSEQFTITKEQVLAWLEKQGEQPQGKSAVREENVDSQNCAVDNVKSKFKAGDWIISLENGCVYQVIEVKRDIYVIRNIYNKEFKIGIESCERTGRLWTIQDARDGEVLAFKNNIGGIIILKSSTSYDTKSYCRLIRDNFINIEENGWDSTLLVPATQEQRDTLYKAMTDAGYTFNFDKKELKKIDNK